MKKVLISLALVGVLILATAVPAMAAESGQAAASVTVNQYISITLADEAPAGITFGNVDPGSSADTNPDETTADFATNGSIDINVENETNIVVDLQIRQDADWDDSPAWPASYSKYCDTYAGTKQDMSTTYADIVNGTAKSGGDSITLWHWLAVPTLTDAGAHSCNFQYQAVAA